jgi:beta-lactamase class C
MVSWRRTSLAGLIVPLALWIAPAPDAVADSDMDARARELVTNHLAPAATSSGAGGLAVAVYVDGHVQFFDYGQADGNQAVTPDTLFNLASLRKVFEATLVALGSLRGELSLDDPVSKYVGELHGDYISRVTIGELVTHTSGLLLATDHPPWPNDSFTQAQFFDMLNAWIPQAGE